MNPEILALLYIAAVIGALIIAILWFLMPLAVFGIKRRLDELLRLERLQLENLRLLRQHLVDEATPNEPPNQLPFD
ncbi:MAG: hypothetical protein VBE63_18285 [Lamprobacter sp.]|uniref:hypothetical protein n=1 Tax=Lamprobacter sp. TaxID=3100796 RepID=UPI002B25BE4F|nr:hypothetical protein [Lamprobacter sp.]MEA3641864.1 hypothetical protein [Lamprobacter sp.]